MDKKQRLTQSTAKDETNLLVIIRLLLSQLHWIILAGLLLAILVFLVVKLFVTPTYESRVSFYVYNSSENTARTGTINNNDLQAAESLATTYSKILGSNSVLDAVLEDLNSDSLSRKELSEMIRASVIADTQLLEVVVTSSNPDFSCKVANVFATVAPTEIVRITKVGGVEVVDRPEVPTEKASPRTVFDTAVGFVLGAVIASLIMVAKMLSDTTIYLPEDLELVGSITILGQIPEISVGDAGFTPWKLSEGDVVLDETLKEKQTGKSSDA